MSILVIIVLFYAGLILGSFINAWVWRLGQQLDEDGNPKKLSKKRHQELSILKGRSMCPNCKHQLAAKDLIPLFSWIALKGKCRYCKAPISKEYPIVEFATAVIFALSYIFWPYTLDGAEWAVFIGFIVAQVPLIAMAIYDIKTKILPSKLIYIATAVYTAGLLLYLALGGDTARLGWAFLAGLSYFVLFNLIFWTSYYLKQTNKIQNEWLGFGDVRLSFLLGLIAGAPMNVFLAMFFASVLGLLVVSPGFVSKKLSATSQIPYGPFMIIGAILAFLFGTQLIDFYTTSILGL